MFQYAIGALVTKDVIILRGLPGGKDLWYNITCWLRIEKFSARGGALKMDLVSSLEAEQIRKDIPRFQPGDTVKVHVKVVEGNRERIQVFEGVVIRRRGGGLNESFTIRRVSYGVGVERTFPVHSPKIDHIDLVRHGFVRRARLYYLRKLRGKAARIREKRLTG